MPICLLLMLSIYCRPQGSISDHPVVTQIRLSPAAGRAWTVARHFYPYDVQCYISILHFGQGSHFEKNSPGFLVAAVQQKTSLSLHKPPQMREQQMRAHPVFLSLFLQQSISPPVSTHFEVLPHGALYPRMTDLPEMDLLQAATGPCYMTFLFLFKILRVKQKIVDVYSQDTIFIIVRLHNIFGNNDFLEGIINFSERPDFLPALCIIRQRIC